MSGRHAGFNGQPTTSTTWRVYDRLRDDWVSLRGRMTEDDARSYAARNPARYALVRVEITETLTEVPVG